MWVAGPSVSQGYWNRPAETAHTFQARLAGAIEGAYLRTGDLGFVHDGALFVTGRLKDTIIIRGHNHYPQDIELTAEQAHFALRAGCGAAFSVDVDGSERLVLVYEIERQHRNITTEEIATAVRQAVAEQHAIQVHAISLVRPGAIPKTSSGKIQRQACKAQFLVDSLPLMGKSTFGSDEVETRIAHIERGELLSLAPGDRLVRLQAYLRALTASVLQISETRIDLQQPLSSLGLDSLMTLELKRLLEEHLSLQIPVSDFFQNESIEQLSHQLVLLLEAPEPVAPLVDDEQIAGDETPFKLTPGQEALWFLHQLQPGGSSSYHISHAATLRGALDLAALRRAFQVLVERHPALRTTLFSRDGVGFQIVHQQGEPGWQLEDGSGWDVERLNDWLEHCAQCPFDLERGPLLRVYVCKRSAREHILLLVIHHIIADLWSLTIFMRELSLLYALAKKDISLAPSVLPLPRWHYRDYARWQSAMLASEQGESLWHFWRQKLEGELSVLDLPLDHVRPAVQTYRGATYFFTLDARLSWRLNALAKARGVTMYTLLLSAFQVLLHRYTGQHDILVGSPTAGRGGRAELEDIIGYFVQPIVQRALIDGHEAFGSFLQRNRQQVLESLARQDYPFPWLVDRLAPQRDPGHSPIFQAMFAFQQTHQLKELSSFVLGESSAHLDLDGVDASPLPLRQRHAKFDLTLEMVESEHTLPGCFEYNRDLFEEATIERLAQGWQRLLAVIAAVPDCVISELPVMSTAAEAMLKEVQAGVIQPIEQAQCLHQLFEQQVEYTPDAPAACDDHDTLTYRQLNEQANELAVRLQSMGVGPETLVGICLQRTPRLLVTLLAVLKAGGPMFRLILHIHVSAWSSFLIVLGCQYY
ncbi:hypothetical protein KDK_58840 [Dictyobacter kobayashii]|uniref:Carrier domain-containing protein n=1 Tax=Dictyobacter kobayashii TaxID=2014872 RepID=A0A402ASK8_9CHLR|nr:condensation domain-containing protein [Dictyobacter kobayashii]GCE22084.1 hypothetical protein KDK_58840 [Dictyobacter kobayashii]